MTMATSLHPLTLAQRHLAKYSFRTCHSLHLIPSPLPEPVNFNFPPLIWSGYQVFHLLLIFARYRIQLSYSMFLCILWMCSILVTNIARAGSAYLLKATCGCLRHQPSSPITGDFSPSSSWLAPIIHLLGLVLQILRVVDRRKGEYKVVWHCWHLKFLFLEPYPHYIWLGPQLVLVFLFQARETRMLVGGKCNDLTLS